MSNMSYCRFENTYQDLEECYSHLEDDNLSSSEFRYRQDLIELCRNIVQEADQALEDGV